LAGAAEAALVALMAVVGFFGPTRHLSVVWRQEDEASAVGDVVRRQCCSHS
jgi:hypothetical protein